MLSMKPSSQIFAIVGLLLAGFLTVGPSTSASADDCHLTEDNTWECTVETGDPGSGGGPVGGTRPAGFTPGPTSCEYPGDIYDRPAAAVPCSTSAGWWSTSSNCSYGWVQLQTPQQPPGPGRNPQVGAWYDCTTYVCANPTAADTRACYDISFWSNTPPPGIDRYSPAQAAGLAKDLLNITSIDIGMAPANKVHSDDPVGTAPYRRTWVGIPVWLWVDAPSPQTWGPASATATYGGVTVTVTGRANQVVWNNGAGETITCGSGTRFDVAVMGNQAAVDSPSCGWRYKHRGDYTVTATTTWVVEWTGGGETGAFAMPTTSSSAVVQVGQLQSVNTPTGTTSNGGDG